MTKSSGLPDQPNRLAGDHDAGTRDHRSPIDVGDVLAVGAGAVTSALVYWLCELGVTDGTWDFLDRDDAELHNTNRCRTMTAAQAGWPNGQPTVAACNKATAVAQAIGGRPHPVWYDQWQPHQQGRHDLVLPLANERGVRRLIAQRGESLLPARDHFTELDCRASPASGRPGRLHRLPPPVTTTPRMRCSIGPLDVTNSKSPDAALPFLSAAAGLMLAAALAAVPNGPAMTGRMNHWQLDLTLSTPLLRQHQHRLACQEQPSAALHRLIREFEPHRWDYLDNADE